MSNEVPRRARLDLNTPAEIAIRGAIHGVEVAGADVRLTDAVVLLGAALDSVADFVDGIDTRRYVHTHPEILGESIGPGTVLTVPVGDMQKAFAGAFEEWDRRYRENPRQFMTEVEHILGYTPTSYGEACGAYFVKLLDELAAGKPWDQIGAAVDETAGIDVQIGNATDDDLAFTLKGKAADVVKVLVEGMPRESLRQIAEAAGVELERRAETVTER